MKLRLIAPAKINWTLEVLGLRDDGYHEIRTVFQTIALHDTVVLSAADELELRVAGAAASEATCCRRRSGLSSGAGTAGRSR